MKTTVYKHLKNLAETIGTRPKGSKANNLAASYIENHFHRLGIEFTRQEFPSIRWNVTDVQLCLGEMELVAYANGYCIPCNLIRDFEIACTLDEISSLNCTNKILVLYGDIVKTQIEAKPQGIPRYFPETSRKLYELLEEKKPSALIIVSYTDRKICLHDDCNFTIPSLTVPVSTGRQLLLNNGKTKLKINVQSERSNTHSWNILAKLQGAHKERIVICSHFDTKFYSPGAYDNASGMALLLALADIFVNKNWAYSIEFLCLNGEEITGIMRGSDKYLASQKLEWVPFSIGMQIKQAKQFEAILAAINLDRVGLLSGTDSIGVGQGSSFLKKLVLDCKQDYPGIIYKNASSIGNHYMFTSHGVPSIHCSSSDNMNIAHTVDDMVDWVSEHKLSQMLSLCHKILLRLMDENIKCLRKRRG